MKSPEIKIGGKEVFASGNIVHPASETVTIKPTGSGDYTLEFRFLVDPSAPEQRGLRNFNEGKGHVIVCTNFDKNNGFPITITAPIHVANHNGRKMFLYFSSLLIGAGAVRELSYTFYDGGPVNG